MEEDQIYSHTEWEAILTAMVDIITTQIFYLPVWNLKNYQMAP